MAHCDAIRYRDGTELAWGAAGRCDALLDRLGLTHQGDVARRGLVPAGCDTDEGLIVFLTLGLDSAKTLADAHELASRIEERVRRVLPGVADVIVHTEP